MMTARARLGRRGLLAMGTAASVASPIISAEAANPDATMIARAALLLSVGADLDAIDRSNHSSLQLPHDHPWWKAYEANVDRLLFQFTELTEELLEFRPQTVLGLRAQAQAVAAAIEQECSTRTNVPLGEDGAPHERLAWQFARDMLRLTENRT